MASDAKAVIHRGVALMLCDNEAVLEETLLSFDTVEMPIQRIGDRAIVAPAYLLEDIRRALHDRGTYPRVVGKVVTPEDLEREQESDDEASSQAEEANR